MRTGETPAFAAQEVFFGDSLETGQTATSLFTASWPYLRAYNRGDSVPNIQAVSGDQAADQAAKVYARPSADGYHIALGTNDQRLYGTNAGKLDNYKAILAAEIGITTLTLTPANDASVSYSGSWVAGYTFGQGFGKRSYTQNSTATFIFSGNVLYLFYEIQDGNSGTFSLTVDGGTPANFSTTNGSAISTSKGTTYAPALAKLSGFGAASHTAVLKVTSATSGGTPCIYFDGFATSANGKSVAVYNVTYMTASGYSTYGGSSANVDTYNAAIADVVSWFAAVSADVTLVNVNAAINPATDIGPDGLHPSQSGQFNYANTSP